MKHAPKMIIAFFLFAVPGVFGQMVSVTPITGAGAGTSALFTAILQQSLEKNGYTPQLVNLANLPSDIPAGGYPPYMCPSPSVTKFAPYALTGELRFDESSRNYNLRLYLWEMSRNRLVYSDEMIASTRAECEQNIPLLLTWLFSHTQTLDLAVVPPPIHPREEVYAEERFINEPLVEEPPEEAPVIAESVAETPADNAPSNDTPPDETPTDGEAPAVEEPLAKKEPLSEAAQESPADEESAQSAEQEPSEKTAAASAEREQAEQRKAVEKPPSGSWLYLGLRAGSAYRLYNRTTADPFAQNEARSFYNVAGAVQLAVHLAAFFDIQMEGIFTTDYAPFTDAASAQESPAFSMSFMIPVLVKVGMRTNLFTIGALGGIYGIIPVKQMQNSTLGGSFDYSNELPIGYTVGIDLGIKIGPGYVFLDTRWAQDLGKTVSRTEDEVYKRSMISLHLGYEVGIFKKN